MHPKPTSFFFVLILFLALLAPASVQADIDGFKDMRWGSNLADLQQSKKLTLTKEGGKSGTSLYVLENEELRFGKATLTGIHCSFAKERLQGVMLLFSGAKNFAAVKAAAFAKFGESAKIEQSGEEMYNWPGTITNVILSYNRGNQSGLLFMKVKKMPPTTKTATKNIPPATAQQKTAPTPTAGHPPPQPAARPVASPPPSPASLETALDQEPPLPPQPPPPPDNAQGITPEIFALIDQDQALTRMCLETTGPVADSACMQMRQNVERLKELGMCRRSGSSGAFPGAGAIIWYQCQPAVALSPQATPMTSGPAPNQPLPPTIQTMPQQQVAQQTMPQTMGGKPDRCQLIGELFATAAQMRDSGAEPQVAEQELAWQIGSQTPDITIERIRETVELVYFDQEYRSISGDALIQRVSNRCLSGRGPFINSTP
jgi:hypothetical protein